MSWIGEIFGGLYNNPSYRAGTGGVYGNGINGISVTVAPISDSDTKSLSFLGQVSYLGASIRADYNFQTSGWTVSIGGGGVLGRGPSGWSVTAFTGVGVSADGLVISSVVSGILGGFWGTKTSPYKGATVTGSVIPVKIVIPWDDLFTNFPTEDFSNLPDTPCFPAGTPIALTNGTTAPIESFTPQDNIASFAEHGQRLRGGTCLSPVTSPLRTGMIKGLHHNITDEWVTLAITEPDGGEISYLTSTPGHVMLTPAGGYRRLCDMIDGAVVPLKSVAIKGVKGAKHYRPVGTVQLVLADGRIAKAEAHSIKYSAATARLFEQTEMLVTLTEHGLALKPEMHKGWKTYNFEVEKYHTYVAGGVRVHNTSANSLGFVENGFDVSGIFGAGVASTSAVWDGRATAALAALGIEGNAYTPSLSSQGIVVSADADTGWVSVSNSITGVTTVTTPTGLQAIDYSNSPGLTGGGYGGNTGGNPTGGTFSFDAGIYAQINDPWGAGGMMDAHGKRRKG